MNDYIKREDAVKALRTIRKCVKLFEDSIEDAAVALNEQSADVVERKGGEWNTEWFDNKNLPVCSNCGCFAERMTDFCPNCGAKMKGVDT